MTSHSRFHFKTIEELQQQIEKFGLNIPTESDHSILFEPVQIAAHNLTNRFTVHPMEGFDADTQGTPQALSFRRYQRYAAGGSALIWFEATAVVPEARSNSNQFYIHPGNTIIFKKLVQETVRVAQEETGKKPLLILQLTHSGRYSKPAGVPKPLLAHHSEVLDPKHKLPADYPLVTDDYLDRLQEKFVSAAGLAFEAGFDGIDVKSCHRYLVSELFASFSRENSRYGGNFENRTRFLIETLTKIHQRFPEKIVTTRMNVFDAIRYPFGFGVNPADYQLPDLAEPIQLISQLTKIGIPLLNISIGNPYFNPHFGRPFDFTIRNGEVPREHPLVGIARFLEITRQIQQAFPKLPVIGSGYTWLRNFMPQVAAGVIKNGGATLIGQGRGMFAYPDSVRDLAKNGKLDPRKVCVTCSACTQIMRDGSQTGCVVRDSRIYGPIYRNVRKMAPDILVEEALRCRDCHAPTCQDKCPAGVDVPAFIKAFAGGNISQAYAHLSQNNLLPEICAYVCPADVLCEGGCVEKIFTGKAVRIQDIQRAISQAARKQDIIHLSFPEKLSGKKIAIVGAGAAGLTCAAALIQKGHSAAIFDARKQPGGIVRSLLPPSRITAGVVDREVQTLLSKIPRDRLRWQLGTPLTGLFNLDALLNDFDAIFLAIGLTQPIRLFENPPAGVIDALTFLEQAKTEKSMKLPDQIAVIGGGNTAMDAASTARKFGARDVYLIYRRSFAELPAWPGERNEALNLGVHFLILSQPAAWETDDQNRVKAIQLARTRLGEPDKSGRRRPVTVPGETSVLPVAMVIEAIGQKPPQNLSAILPGVKTAQNGLIDVQANSLATSRKGVFAGGDIVNGGTTAVQAVAEGLLAANEIHKYLL